MPVGVDAHAHRYYPISFDEHGQPALWACNGPRSCIRTLNRKDYERLKRQATKEGRAFDGPAPV